MKAVFAGIITTLFFFSCAKKTEVEFYPLKKKDVRETVLANGRVGGSRIISLSAQKSGVILKVKSGDGAFVKRGDTIAILDNKNEFNQVSQAKTSVEIARINLAKSLSSDAAKAHEDLKQAEAREELSKREWERADALHNQGALSKADLDRAQQNYILAASTKRSAETRLKELEGPEQQLLQARLDQAKAQLESAVIDLSKTILRAPDKGQIVRLTVQPGNSVSASAPICEFLASDTATYVELLVDEDAARSIRTGQLAFVSALSDTGSPKDAVVKSIIPLIDASRGTITVQLTVTGSQSDFLPDQAVSAQIIVKTYPATVAAPQRFIKNENGTLSVFVLNKNRSILKTIKAEPLGGGLLRIDSGAADNDTLLFAPLLKNNSSVTLKGF
ncbi:MAG: efflux RND transporter periplasmic adaptor subunit [Fibrobacteres bacterium]|nr:efflux RND transporter periplasmic adaptor subunit [Fibrobacterota bacterium]